VTVDPGIVSGIFIPVPNSRSVQNSYFQARAQSMRWIISAGVVLAFPALLTAAEVGGDSISISSFTAAMQAIDFSAWYPTVGVVALLLALLLGFLYMTRAGIIARAATKEAVRQPVFPLLIALSILMLIVNTFIPFFSLGDDVKMLEICGLATMLICGMLLAVWTASISIADEIEGKTAMTLLSKPINRRQFILGKFIGIQTGVLLMMIPVVIVFGLLVYYKVFYDARESSNEANAAIAIRETFSILPGAALCFLEITIMSAISVAISTRLPMVVNMSICLTVFVVGHLTHSLVGANLGRLEPVMFMARVIAIALPAVENFNIETAIVQGAIVPPVYLGWTMLYTVLYSTMAILVAFLLFEDRDLA
jgi:ABC-type transport system involved in multi-copper enzyme maturation permease subunit